MPPRLAPEAAIAIMRKAGVEPTEPYRNSSTPWRCGCLTCGQEVTPRLDNVRANHAACGFCARRAVAPDEAVEVMRAAGLEPLEPYPGSMRPWLCRCTRCGSRSTPRHNSVSKGTGCRYCGNERIRQALRLNAEQAASVMRAAGVEPLALYPGAGSPWKCRCVRCGGLVTPRYTDVRGGHGGCRSCAYDANADRLRLDHETAAVLMVERGLEPLEQYPGAVGRWRCRCLGCGAEVTPRYGNIRQGWGGCRACGSARAGARRRSPEVDAIDVMRAAGLEPIASYRNAIDPWPSQCRVCGNQATPRLNNVKSGQGGCKWCAHCAVDPRDAIAFMRSVGLEPLAAYPGANAPWPCTCQHCHNLVTPRYQSVRKGSGCRYCNDTTINHDEAAALMRRAGLEPLETYPGSLSPWTCRCNRCGQTVRPCYSTIQQGNGGCRWCRDSGFKADKDAIVYLITHADHRAAKIGITGAATTRLKRHAYRGWQALITVHVAGELALTIEKEILDWWRGELALPAHLGKANMPEGGWTETVDATAIDLSATIRRIHHLAAQAQPTPVSPAPTSEPRGSR